MKRNLAATILFGLVLVLAAACAGGNSNESSTSDSDIVDPAVWEALEEQDEIEVYVGLRKLDIPLAEQTTEMRMTHTADVQASVLAVLSSEDFDVTHQFPFTAALSGRITKNGVALAAAHPDVRGISLTAIGIRE